MASLFRRSIGVFLPAALAVALMFIVVALVAMDSLYAKVVADTLGASVGGLAAELSTEGIYSFISPGDSVQAWAERLDAASGLRITLVGPDGTVIVDSRAQASTMENHASRPEIAAALAGRPGFARRTSATIGRELFYAARPVRSRGDDRVIAVLRIAVDLPVMRARLAPAYAWLIAAIMAVGLIAALTAALFSRSVAIPLGRLAKAARLVGQTDYSAAGSSSADAALDDLHRAATAKGPDEIRILGSALSTMATELEGRTRSVALAGYERAAILDSLTEAVLAIDGNLRLRHANRSARALFGIPDGAESSRPLLLEVARSPELARLAQECLASGISTESEIAFYPARGEHWFQVFATPLGGPPGAAAGEGLVLVLNDTTRIRRLERVRKDFVANVSHELRTPVQLVKGFAETLRSGVDDPEKMDRYLGIIERNAARMESLIEDLLILARLEHDGSEKLERRECDLGALVAEAVEAVVRKAEEKGIAIAKDLPEKLSVAVNEGLVVQALVNLLDNAVKYCPPGTAIGIQARVEAEGPFRRLILSVSDRGPGIPLRHLPRIFERFYRIDAARSREFGGTGLGLAIVRHIALAHGGEVAVESWEGEGTRFTLTLPV